MTPSGLTWTVRRHRARRTRYAALAAGAAVALVAGMSLARPWQRTVDSAWLAPAAGDLPPDAASTPRPSTASPPGSILAGAPTGVRIATIGVDAPLAKLHLDPSGALAAPTTPDVPGWYAEGTAPGDIGPAVIAGHVDSRVGPAVFFRLHELRAGDRIEVARGGRWLTFQVVATDRYPKDAFPTARVYGPTPDRQLRLITCGGAFDTSRQSYRDNVVVYAVEV